MAIRNGLKIIEFSKRLIQIPTGILSQPFFSVWTFC